jgi:hypothetical protein
MATHKPSNFLSKAWVVKPEAMTFVRAEQISTENWIHSGRKKEEAISFGGKCLAGHNPS